MNNVKVDKKEFFKQKIELIKKSDSYLEYKVIVPKFQEKFSDPIVCFEPHNIGALEIAMLLFSIEQSIKHIIDMPNVKTAYEEIKKNLKFETKKIDIEGGKK